ncbi:zinc finger CCHC domain-containing protein 3-like [Latimeria chalumnae]|uniref:zinc finger CCHC domain-containing protein 3-like n=1 Tax=Latimeria chalumnae TaxID=7897 RepID=UPI00313DC844
MEADSGGALEEEVVPGCSSAAQGQGNARTGNKEARDLPEPMEAEQGQETGTLDKRTDKKSTVSKPERRGNTESSNKSKLLFSDILRKNTYRNESQDRFFESKRRNVVRLYYVGKVVPDREWFGKKCLIESLHFTALQVYALIHITGSRDFDISFRNGTYLDLFWSRYNEVKSNAVWEDFIILKSSWNNHRTITILFNNESVSETDILFWLNRQVTVTGELNPIHDVNGFWNAGYRVRVELDSIDNELIHLPNTFSIGRDRGYIFYPGQPRNCHKCGASDHFSTRCTTVMCRKCGSTDHISRDCEAPLRCNLCYAEGHVYINCPHSAKNNPPENILTAEEYNVLVGESEVAANQLAEQRDGRARKRSGLGEPEEKMAGAARTQR